MLGLFTLGLGNFFYHLYIKDKQKRHFGEQSKSPLIAAIAMWILAVLSIMGTSGVGNILYAIIAAVALGLGGYYFFNLQKKRDAAPMSPLTTDESINTENITMTDDVQMQIFEENYDLMDGHEFERFCAALLLKDGFSNADVTSGSGDHGVDILAEKDGITYAIQCKRSSSNIGNKAVQEIFSGKEFYKKHIGVVMTNQYFTLAAKEAAERTGIVLWDREKIIALSNTEMEVRL